MNMTLADEGALAPDRAAPGLLGLAERGLLPDSLIRAGIRRLCEQRLAGRGEQPAEGVEVHPWILPAPGRAPANDTCADLEPLRQTERLRPVNIARTRFSRWRRPL